jgi:hypothetical protein
VTSLGVEATGRPTGTTIEVLEASGGLIDAPGGVLEVAMGTNIEGATADLMIGGESRSAGTAEVAAEVDAARLAARGVEDLPPRARPRTMNPAVITPPSSARRPRGDEGSAGRGAAGVGRLRVPIPAIPSRVESGGVEESAAAGEGATEGEDTTRGEEGVVLGTAGREVGEASPRMREILGARVRPCSEARGARSMAIWAAF